MGIRITLQTCFDISISGVEKAVLPDGVSTVSDLLTHMGREIKFDFIDPESGRLQIEQDLEISLNGKEIWFYPGALNTPMKDGDKVEIYLLPLGGG